jgi:AcrR family transcriptional regulator
MYNIEDPSNGAGGGAYQMPIAAASPRPRKRDRAGKQKALIQAAKDLFASRGFERATTREIAARAGCAEGLIHRYFHGKAGLLFALMRSYDRQLDAQPESSPSGVGLEREIQHLLEWEVNTLWSDRDFLRVAVPRAMLDPEIGRFVSRVGPARRARTIHKRLLQARNGEGAGKERDKDNDKDMRALAQAISALGFALGFVRHVVFDLDPKKTKELTADMARIFSRGLHSA